MKWVGHVHKRLFDARSRLMTVVWYKWLFAETGRKCSVSPPFYVYQPHRVVLGDEVTFGPGCRIETVAAPDETGPGSDGTVAGGQDEPLLVIGNRVRLGHRVAISAMNRVEIGSGTNVASGCYISDNNHAIDPEGPPYRDQPITGSETRIGESVWIGHNVSVLAGANIGDRAVIGAGSVVRGNIPPFSIAVGAPARVVKVYDFNKRAWVRADGKEQAEQAAKREQEETLEKGKQGETAEELEQPKQADKEERVG